MKPRTTLILALVLVVLAAVATLFESNRRKSLSSAGGLVFPAFTVAKADGIVIAGRSEATTLGAADPGSDGRQRVDLRKRGDLWTVASEDGRAADPKPVQQILEAMAKITTSTLISTSKERHAAFEVDTTGFEVRILQGEKALAEFTVGKPGPDFMSTYVRPAGRDDVYLVPVYLRTVVDRGTQSWRNMTIFEIDQERIAGYTTRNSKETVSVKKGDDGAWLITEPEEVKARGDVISVVVRSLATIRASGFAEDDILAPAVGLEPDTTTLVIRLDDGSSQTIVIGTTNAANQSYTRRSGNEEIFLVPRGRWNTIFRPFHLLKAATEAEAAPAPGIQIPGVPAGAIK